MRKIIQRIQSRLGVRVIFRIAFIAVVIVFLFILLIVNQANKQVTTATKEQIRVIAKQYSLLVRSEVNNYFQIIQFLQQTFENVDSIPSNRRRAYLSSVLKNILENKNDLLATWATLEVYGIDSLANTFKNRVGSTALGNFNYLFYNQNSRVVLSSYVENNPGQVFSGEIYETIRNLKLSIITEPDLFSYTTKAEDLVWRIRVASPVVRKKTFAGVVGIDVRLDKIVDIVTEPTPWPNSFVFLVNQEGKIVAHRDKKLIGKTAEQAGLGTIGSFIGKSGSKRVIQDVELILQPLNINVLTSIQLGNTEQYWYLGMIVPTFVINKQRAELIHFSLWLGILGLLVIIFLSYIIINRVIKPLQSVTRVLSDLSFGKINNEELSINSRDEIGLLAKGVDELNKGMREMALFASEIGKGNLQIEYTPRCEQDALGNALLEMRDNLVKLRKNEEEQRKIDEKNRWISEGINRLGEILRQYNQNIQELTYEVLRYFVDYLEVVQGGIYIKNDDDPLNVTYDLTAAVAFGRQKLLSAKIKPEEGLVGRCAAEEEMIYLTDLPEGYPMIRSGLGGATPDTTIVVPLKANGEVLGVVELMSFGSLEDRKIELLQKAAEDMATTISNVRINTKTQKLLEQSQQQSELLAAKEEEMRQTLEEMQATKEEAESRFEQISSLVSALNQVAMVAEFDPFGYITNINDNFLRLLGVNREQMIGRKQGMFDKNLDLKENERMWYRLRSGETVNVTQKIDTGFKTIILSETYVPIKNAAGNVVKVINIATDVTKYQN